MYIQLINLIIALFTDKPLHDKARFEDLDRDLIELKDERINSILNFEERTLYTRKGWNEGDAISIRYCACCNSFSAIRY